MVSRVQWVLLIGLLTLTVAYPATSVSATPEPVMTMALKYQQSERKWFRDRAPLFGIYLGTGDGTAAGRLSGRVGWDLYEDQERADFHPAHFHGFIEVDGERHAFQILGVYTPASTDAAVTPDGKTHPRIWTLSGTIAFDDASVLGARHLPVTGTADLNTWTASYSVWSKP
ncbi:MAG: hypothetical protein HKN35_10855 [Woeseia sp.]|nr:hypothetical protein [Gammaproteobacteria bacterium]NNE61386.1 hypothetical protein [Woeseia sp.]